MDARLKELALLHDGWLDGEGLALAGPTEWLLEGWLQHAGDRQLPSVYPTLDGGLSLEWDGPHGGLDLVVDLVSRRATALLGDEQRQLDLATAAGWVALNDLLDGAPMQA